MIVTGPTSVRIGRRGGYYRLIPGKQVPDEVVTFWRKNKMFDDLLKNNVISEKQAEVKADEKTEEKVEKKSETKKSVKTYEKTSEDIGEVKE